MYIKLRKNKIFRNDFLKRCITVENGFYENGLLKNDFSIKQYLFFENLV